MPIRSAGFGPVAADVARVPEVAQVVAQEQEQAAEAEEEIATVAGLAPHTSHSLLAMFSPPYEMFCNPSSLLMF